MEPIIRFKDFGFKYKAQSSPTLYDINLEIYPGEREVDTVQLHRRSDPLLIRRRDHRQSHGQWSGD